MHQGTKKGRETRGSKKRTKQSTVLKRTKLLSTRASTLPTRHGLSEALATSSGPPRGPLRCCDRPLSQCSPDQAREAAKVARVRDQAMPPWMAQHRWVDLAAPTKVLGARWVDEPQRPRIITSSEFNSAPSKPNQATLQHAEERRRDNNLSIFLLLLQRTYQLFTTTTATHTKKTQPSLLLKAARPEEVLLTITREGVDHRTRSHRGKLNPGGVRPT
jgi:hypothetical protein